MQLAHPARTRLEAAALTVSVYTASTGATAHCKEEVFRPGAGMVGLVYVYMAK